jgi:hypothetical protein
MSLGALDFRKLDSGLVALLERVTTALFELFDSSS